MSRSEGVDRGGPLRDVRVVEVTSSIAGETTGMLLSDLGADVVRVLFSDTPSPGDPEYAGWLCRNRGKRLARSGSPDALALEASDLVRHADMLVTDLSPESLHGSGLDSTAIAQRSPGCGHVWLPPVSAGGGYADLPHDQLLLDGLGGFAAYHPAHDEDRPVASVSPIRDGLHGVLGAMHAAIELVGVARTGTLRPVVVGGLRSQALAMHLLMIQGVDGQVAYGGSRRIDFGPHYRFYRTSDGEWVFLAALGATLFIEALNVLDRIDVLARDDVRGEFTRVLDPQVSLVVGRELERTFTTRTAGDWEARFTAADVPLARVGERAEWFRSNVVAHACPPVVFDHVEAGEVLMPGLPIGFSRTPGCASAPPAASDIVDIAQLSGLWGDVVTRGAGTPPSTRRPLAGFRVAELATYVAAPLIGSLLAGAGADVVKIEPPATDPYRAYLASFAAINHGKRRATLDLRSADGQRELLELARSVDVLIDNLRPASFGRLGLETEMVDEAAPNLIRASVTAFGLTGPFVDHPGFDPILQAMSGLAAAQGGDDRPVATGSPLYDLATGSLGTLGVAAALYERTHSRRGQRVSVSLAATSTFVQAGELTTYRGCPAPRRGGPDYPGPSAWHRYYRASDGWIAVRAIEETVRRALAEALRIEGHVLQDDSTELLRDAFLCEPVDEWLVRLKAAGVPACRVVERGCFDDPHLTAARYFHQIDTPEAGRLRVTRAFEH